VVTFLLAGAVLAAPPAEGSAADPNGPADSAPPATPSDAGPAPVAPEPAPDAPPAPAAEEPAAPEAPASEAPAPEPPPPPVAQNLDDAVAGRDPTGTPDKPARDGEERETGQDEPLPKGEKRTKTDYDGRPEPNTDAGDIVRWGPRILFFPVYLVMEYVLRVPIVWTTTRIEQHHITDKIADFFTWDDGRARLYPIISFDFGVRANVGFTFKWDEALPRHDFAATAILGWDDLYSFEGKVDQKLFRDEEALIRWRGGYHVAPDNVYFGLSDVDARCNDLAKGCRFRSAVADASVGLVGWEERLNQVFFTTTFRHARFENERSDSPPLTDEEAAALPGFDDGYQIIEPRLTFALDTRHEDLDFHTGTGVRLEALSAFAIDVVHPDSRWFRAGAEAGGFYDLGFGQVASASLYYEGLVNVSWPVDGNRPAIPFYELPYLGGNDQMKGFLRRRFMGENALALNLEYRYPIASLLDASVFASVGNTFRDLGTWDISNNYLSYGLALEIGTDRVSSFEAILGWGSNRFDDPSFDPFNQFRLSIGVNRGF